MKQNALPEWARFAKHFEAAKGASLILTSYAFGGSAHATGMLAKVLQFELEQVHAQMHMPFAPTTGPTYQVTSPF